MTNEPLSLRALQRRANVTTVFLAAHAAMGFISLVPATQPFFEFDIETASDDETVLWFAAIGVILFIALTTVISFLMWMHRAAKNLRELEPGQTFQHTPGWCVGWWFIPFANLFKPAYAMHEIWHWSLPADARAQKLEIGKRLPTLLGCWWAAWIASELCDRVGESATHEGWAVAAVLANLAAATLCILVIRTVTSSQRSRYLEQRGMPLAEGVGHVPHA